MQAYAATYQIPWSKFVVITNGIEPIDPQEKYDDNKIHCVYTPTPHRGLDVLAQAWDIHNQTNEGFKDKFVLDVYSSFALYGWEEKNEDFQKLYSWLESQDNIVYHGTKSNEEVREALSKSHMFLYPSCWQETSCLCLIEAMSAGLICVHSNLGALYETSSNFTEMYHYHEDKTEHTKLFAQVMASVIQNIDALQVRTKTQKQYVDTFYNWKLKLKQWEMLITHMLNMPREEAPNPEVMLTFES
jgi:glycosyltransferase involved in cell wall biosynthesis